MSRPLTDLERELLDVLARDPADVAARAGLAELWTRRGAVGHGALVRARGPRPGPDETQAIEARLRAPLERAGYATPHLAFADGLLAIPLAIAAGGPLDGDPDLPRSSPRWYRVTRRLTDGTSARVHEAEALTPRSSVAVVLKVPHAATPRAVATREQAVLASVAHPNVPRVLGPVLHPDGPGHALAHAGVDLEVVLDAARTQEASLGVGFALSAAIQVCEALAALQAAGVVHGALRPEHLVVSAAGVVTVVGLGHDHAAEPTPPSRDAEEPIDLALRRAVRYLAPEQVTGRPGPGSDVWATAIIACELATGEPPIPARLDDAYEILQAVLAGVEPPPSLPSTIRDALRAALAPEPGRRPTPAALRDALLAAAAGARLAVGPEVLARGLAALDRPAPEVAAPSAPAPAPPTPAPAPAPTPTPPPPAAPAPAARCWCLHLAAGIEPDVDSEDLTDYLRTGLEKQQYLFSTAEHYGDADLLRCRRCGGPVVRLLVEHEGFTGSIHRYYTVLTTSEWDALASGTLNGASYEDWAGDRCGIHDADGRAAIYARARIGYLGLDHRLS